MMGLIWVYYEGRLTYVIEELNDPMELADMYPDAIYFEAGFAPVPLED